MDHKHPENLFAIVAPGLEAICARELAGLGMADLEVVPGGIGFIGRLADLYRANLRLRTASRVVVRFARFRCRAFPDLYRAAARLPWGRFLRSDTPVHCRVTSRNSRLIHTGRIAETLQAAIGHALGQEVAPVDAGGQLLLARVVDDIVELSIDSSGELLHRRGYRTSVAAAPLRESLAAGVLGLLDWDGGEPLADPLCGTGTFLLEGALLAAGRVPGLQRQFAFMHWPGYRAGLWEQLCSEARREERLCPVAISGGDADAGALAAADANLARAGLVSDVVLHHLPLAAQPVHSGSGLVVCNPPYGKRLTTDEPMEDYFAGLGRELRRAYPRWRKALLCPDPRLARATGLPLRNVAELDNGGLKVFLYATD
ncbi:MAG: class I SAM-dependent RNA methyltransferase [Desulfuromonas sp.]|nr:class I SAM-dependent RNA methyltransferase [Desulfuromonas sp.]